MAALGFVGGQGMSDLITMDDLSNDEILEILDAAERLLPVANGDVYAPLLQGKVLGNLFFENSTRTRMSFESAMKRLGGEVVNLSSVGSSVAKGETLYDTMQMVDGYSDIAVIRHPRQGAAQYSADAIGIPVLNAGDGAGNHPTQTMLDLFTIHHGDCPHAPGAMRQQSRAIVASLEAQSPGARHGLLHALEQIRELYREARGNHQSDVTNCQQCGEITSRPICQSCIMKQWLTESSQ